MGAAEQIDAVRSDLVAAQASLATLADGSSDGQFVARPASGGWSAAECVAHLTMTTDFYLPLLERAASGVRQGTPLPRKYRRGFFAWLLEWMLEPPSRARTKTLPAFIPEAAAPRAVTIAAFDESQRKLLAWINSARNLGLQNTSITSPFNDRLKYNAYAALRILAAHQRRHLWQAERATRGVP